MFMAWDISDVLSRVLWRATTLSLDNDEGQPTVCIIPLHDRLDHASTENSKLVCSSHDEILLVATRDIAAGESITRNYGAAPFEGAMRLLFDIAAWTITKGMDSVTILSENSATIKWKVQSSR
jgi:hypothetical protein